YVSREKLAAQAQEKDDSKKEFINYYDFALLKLNQEAPAKAEVAEILEDVSALARGATVTAAGYGLVKDLPQEESTVLQKTQLKIIDSVGSEVAVDQSQGSGICSGDSGGPAFIEVNGKQYVWGVASRVGNYQEPDKYCSGVGVHGNVTAVKGYVDLILNRWGIQ
ncbi:MAG: trypsin-like serine protease, partial [Bdellovibrio sp.]